MAWRPEEKPKEKTRLKRLSPAIMGAAVLLLLLPIIPSALAADSGDTTIAGTLVDVACATANAKKPKPDFAVKHDKDCLQMPDCEKSGYAVLTPDNKIIRFDATGNKLAKDAIAKTDKENDFKISVEGKLNGDQIEVTSLKLQ